MWSCGSQPLCPGLAVHPGHPLHPVLHPLHPVQTVQKLVEAVWTGGHHLYRARPSPLHRQFTSLPGIRSTWGDSSSWLREITFAGVFLPAGPTRDLCSRGWTSCHTLQELEEARLTSRCLTRLLQLLLLALSSSPWDLRSPGLSLGPREAAWPGRHLAGGD